MEQLREVVDGVITVRLKYGATAEVAPDPQRTPTRGELPRRLGPALPIRRKAATPVAIDYHKKYGKPATPGTRNKGSPKGVRGVRPLPILEPVPIDTPTDAGGAIRRQRRALGHTAESVCESVGVWGTCLLGMERGRDMKLSTFLRVLAGLGLQLTVTRRDA